MANPDPEITPEEARAVRPDAIIATGRSDYPNQVNNVLGFPYIFRGALDVRARTINDAMKIAAAEALAALAREDVPDEVRLAARGQALRFGPDYIIPNAFDPRLISRIAPEVARAAMASGVARRPVEDLGRYGRALAGRLDPTGNALSAIFEAVRANPRDVVFAEGEEERAVRAAVAFCNAGYGRAVLIGREERVAATMTRLGLPRTPGIEVHNARLSHANRRYADYLYARLQRRGYLFRDCQRMVNQDRNVFAACMVACGDAAALLTGLTRATATCLEEIGLALDTEEDEVAFGLSLMIGPAGTLFVADTLVHERPRPEQIAAIACGAARAARRLGHEPRVAILSHSNFGQPLHSTVEGIRAAVAILDGMKVDFEYDGDMSPEVALDAAVRTELYPFCRLTADANVLVMPGLHSAHISSRLAPRIGAGTTIGPLLIGLKHPAQMVPMGASVGQIVDLACLAAHQAIVAG
jgi:malate dehydrogenase (oxaloacetate-decarboxylating)(NADP+)